MNDKKIKGYTCDSCGWEITGNNERDMAHGCDDCQPSYVMRLGHFGVDSGLLWIGDPCYIDSKDPLNYEDEVARLESEHFCEVPFSKGNLGRGILCRTYQGDGEYPVYGVFRRGEVVPHQLIIDLDFEEQDDDEDVQTSR